MSIKLIAVDMDGTFLDDNMEYNRKRFSNLYQKMLAENIKFVVASGNQYYQLRSFFPEIKNEIAYVAENGAYVVMGEKEIFAANIYKDTVNDVLAILEEYPEISTIVCGKKSAYVNMQVSQHFFEFANKYYHRLKRVDDLTNIDDQIVKFALNCPLKLEREIYEKLIKSVGEILTPVFIGNGDIDLIVPGCHKAHGLKQLQQLWGIKDSEIMAFGNGDNDIEMLAHAGFGFAMQESSESAVKSANFGAPSNNEEGVLEIISEYFDNKEQFLNTRKPQ
jgi:HAD-superfamily hydrolase, subfamily IIB